MGLAGVPAVSTQARLYISPTLVGGSANSDYATAPDESYEFLTEGVQARKTIIDASGIRGTRSHHVSRTAQGNYTVTGPLEFNPTGNDLSKWLPRILGADASGTTYALAETLPDFYYSADRVTEVFHYTGCKVDTATFSAAEGELLKLAMSIEGLTEIKAAYTSSGAVSPITSPASLDTTMHPLRFVDGVFTLVGGVRPVKSFSLTVDNQLIKTRFNNNIYRTALPEGDRIVRASFMVPFTYGSTTAGNADLYDQTYSGSAATLVFTSTVDTNVVFTLSLATLQVEAQTPVPNGRDEIMLTVDGIARMSGSTRELIGTLVLS